jgi:hypothetical protein
MNNEMCKESKVALPRPRVYAGLMKVTAIATGPV